MFTLVLASSNVGKRIEIEPFLPPEIKLLLQQDLGLNDIDETGLSFVENAILKARHATLSTGLPALADDSGLMVTALKGEPGIYSARYAGEHGNSQANIGKLLRALEGVPWKARQARFCCSLALILPEHVADPIIFQGSWEGYILSLPQGEHGFGYDPVFWVPEYQCSAAELAPEIKHQISHRGQALKKLQTFFAQRLTS